MDTFTLTFTCTCGEPTEETFLDNEGSKLAMLNLIETAILADVQDVQVIRNKADGTKHDETFAILMAMALVAMIEGR